MTYGYEQGTIEWLRARAGKATASRIADIITKTKTGWGAGRANYAAQLVAERLTGEPSESFTNAAMQWGTNTEPQARAAYAFHHDADVLEVGFIEHPVIKWSGASPDGMVGPDGMIEIKCPNTATHIDTLLRGEAPNKYVTQMMWQMACTGRQWCDFVSFDPRMPENMQMFVKRVPRDDSLIVGLEKDVAEFLSEVERTVAALLETYEHRKAA